MKEFVLINIIFFLNLTFGQVVEKNYGKDWFCLIYIHCICVCKLIITLMFTDVNTISF